MTTEKIKRKLTAILSADVKGYSRLMGDDEVGTIRILQTYRGVMSDLIQKKGGRVVDSPGDNVLAEFASVVDALESAVEIQRELKVRNADRSENRRMEFRIGINLGDVVEEGERIYGDGVNIAARIEGLADGGGICISGTAFDHIGKRLPLGYEYIGEQAVKNIEKPVRVYRVLMEPEQAGKVIGEKGPKPAQWRWVAVAVGIILVAGALALWNFYFRPPPIEPASKEKMALPLPDKPSIAVLPFVNMSDDPKQEFFSDAVAENIITGLSKDPRLLVIARNSTFTYKGKPVKIKQVSEELGVQYVLEGSVQKSSDRIRITAQLIDALKGHHIWAERYERDLEDLFALQDEITLKILSALHLKLMGTYRSSTDQKYYRGKQSFECYSKLAEGAGHMQLWNIEDNNVARRLVEEAIAMCPEIPSAYSILGWVYHHDYYLGSTKSPQEAFKKSFELAQKALALDDSIVHAHALLCLLYSMKGDHDKAIAEGERAVSLDPGGADALSIYAWSIYVAGRHEEAVLLFQKAIRLNPFGGASVYRGLGQALRETGRMEEAVPAFKTSIQRSPNDIITHVHLTITYSLMGREKDASTEAAEVLRINPKFSVEQYAKTYRDESRREAHTNALRKAGLK
jgi:adenylate cyclase